MRRGTSSSRPLLEAILVLLFVYLHAGLVMPDEADVIFRGIGLGTKVVGKGKPVVNAFNRGLQWGHKGAKAFDRYSDHKQSPASAAAAGKSGYVDFVSIAGNPLIPVGTASITSTAAVQIAGVGCDTATPVPPVATSIRLLGPGGTVNPLGDLYRASYLACRELPNARNVQAWAVLGLGRGGELSTKFPTFSYLVTPNGMGTQTRVWIGPVSPHSPQQGGGQYQHRSGTTLLSGDSRYPGRYYVHITGIRIGVGDWVLPMSQPGVIGESAYLSTDSSDTFTYLAGVHYTLLKLALILKFFPTNVMHTTSPAPQRSEQLCYSANDVAWSSLPPMALVFPGNTVMDVPVNNLWYREGPNYCLAILPAKHSIIGSSLQSGKLMTISTQKGTSYSYLKFEY